MSQKIRIKLKSYDHQLVDKSADKIVKAVKATGAIVSGPIPLPTHKRIYTVNRSTFVNKKAREQFQLSDYKRLIDMGLEVQEPEGAFYMFINIEKYGMDSLTFCEKMLKEGLVGLIPGIYFGTEGYARLSYCYSDEDLKEGLDRIEKFIKTL